VVEGRLAGARRRAQIDARRLVFVEEMGSNTSLFSLYASKRVAVKLSHAHMPHMGENASIGDFWARRWGTPASAACQSEG